MQMILLVFAFLALATSQTTCSTGITNQVVGWVYSGSSTNTAAQTCNTFYSNTVLSATSSPALPSGFSSGAGRYSLQSSNLLGDSYNIRVGHVPASSTNGGRDPGTSFIATSTILTVSSSRSLNANTFASISVPAGRKPAISICCSNSAFVCSNNAGSSLNICWDTTSTGAPLTTTTTAIAPVTTRPAVLLSALTQYWYGTSCSTPYNYYQWNRYSIDLCTPRACAPSSGGTIPYSSGTVCNVPLPAYTTTDWVFKELYWGNTTCTRPDPNYYGQLGPNGQCVVNTLAVQNADQIGRTSQLYVQYTCNAESLSWITCDDSACSSNCNSGTVSANTNECVTGAGATGPLYYKYYCATVAPPLPTVSSTSRVTTSSSSSSSTPSPSGSWAGTYQVNTGCSQSSCCCLTGQVVVTQSGTTVSVQSPIAGQCGTFTSPTSFSFVLSSSTATTASATVLGQPFTFSKSGNVVTATNVGFPSCSGSATLLSGSTTTSPSGGSATPCFHESTVITYKGHDYHLKDFQSADSSAAIGECRVPHVVKSDGVRITTAHGVVLRLTGDHLVFTGRGLIAADQITTADTLFGPGGERITVASIEHESNQVYFGLNCLESIVYANGIRTSTFGKYHKIPELWMKYAGSLIGVHRASSIGDSIVELLARARII